MKEHIFSFLLMLLLSEEVLGDAVEPKTRCWMCSCYDKIIDCRSQRLNKSFDESDWSKFSDFNFSQVIMDNNHIGHVVKFPTLPLVKLSFKNNRIVKIDDRAFRNLTSLEELDLSDNQLTSENLLPAAFEGPFDVDYYEPLKLKILDLSSNELHMLHQNLFQHLPFLERLYLKQNPLKILDKSTTIAISSVPNLEVLDLSFTKISKLPPGFLHTPRKLHELVLKGNLFTEVPSDVLVESHDLKILNLNENPIKVLSTERPFPEIPSLKQLHISFMPNLTRIEERSLSGLSGLDYLYCKMNEKLTYISPLALSRNETEEKWPDIVKLDLSDNSLRYIDKDFLRPAWKKIKHINILGNPLVCDCENQWIVSELVPLMMNISTAVNGLECAEPPEMKGKRLVTLYANKYNMRCLDLYGNHPERDGPILISIFVIIIVLLITALAVVVWLKNISCRKGGRVDYHRAFYKRARLDDVDKY